jgi:hypothetical protein
MFVADAYMTLAKSTKIMFSSEYVRCSDIDKVKIMSSLFLSSFV